MRRAHPTTTLLLSLALLTGCVSGRSVEEALVLAAAYQSSWPSQLAPEALQAAVERAADQMELDLERPSPRVGQPWVFYRGARLYDPALWWVVTIQPNPDSPGHSIITVGGAPEYRNFPNTGETISKGGELAARIVVIAMDKNK